MDIPIPDLIGALRRYRIELGKLLPEDDHTASAAGLGLLQVLLLLQYAGPMIASALAAELPCTTAAMTGLLDRGEKLKLVLRMRLRNDRRKIRVSITAEGMTFLERVLRIPSASAESRKET